MTTSSIHFNKDLRDKILDEEQQEEEITSDPVFIQPRLVIGAAIPPNMPLEDRAHILGQSKSP